MNYQLDFVVAPEPSALILALVGMSLIALSRYARQDIATYCAQTVPPNSTTRRPLMHRRYRSLRVACACCACALASNSRAATVWTGPNISFTKSAATPSDTLTPNVVLTRGSSMGMYNSAAEAAFNSVTNASPVDTEWATPVNNPSATVTATNFGALSFTDWTHAYGGPGSGLQTNILKPAVVHLISDNIYLNLQFTTFSSGGVFSYQRSTPAPEPASVCLLLTGVPALLAMARYRRRADR
jgi:hypothetical protein